MSVLQSILVPQISSLPHLGTHSQRIVRWLSGQRLIDAQLSTCGRLGNGMAHAIGEGARRLPHAERLPFGQPYNGLQVVTLRSIYTPTVGFLEEAGCPECRQEVGVALFESLDEWSAGVSDNFTCPECGHEDDINGFLFLQPCAFSNLAFVFNGWPPECFSPQLLEQFAERLGFAVRLVQVHG